jgi:protease I
MSSQKILLVTGDGGETYEVLYAKHRFMEAGYSPVIAAPTKKPLNLVIHDFSPGWDTYIEKPGYLVSSDITISELKAADYAAVLLLGGRAPEYLRNDHHLLAVMRDFGTQKKPIFSLCHGIQILIAAGLAKGRSLTCYEHVKTEVLTAGGEWIGQEAVRDGNIVCGQTWNSHPDFYRYVFDVLNGK